jgi:hypothetical protein
MRDAEIVTHCHSHEWVYDREGESLWLCRCGDTVIQYEDANCGR